MSSGMLLVVSAPSGAGKHTILHAVLDRDKRLAYAVTATTRAPRSGELNGRDYYFLDEPEFRRRIAADGFLEWAEVHGHLYGTPRAELEQAVESGQDVVLSIDVQGVRTLKEEGCDAVTVFVMPPSLDALEQRLQKRGANDAADIALRIENARGEMAEARHYDFVIVNDQLEMAVADLEAIVRAQRCRAARVLSARAARALAPAGACPPAPSPKAGDTHE